MNTQLIKTFIEELDSAVKESRENGYNYFKQNWKSLDIEAKEIVRLLLMTPYMASIFGPDSNIDDKIYYAAILNLSQKEDPEYSNNDIEPLNKLKLHKDVKKNQIVKIFYDLKVSGKIVGTHEQIADAIAAIFDISYQTAYTYLTDSSRFNKTEDLI